MNNILHKIITVYYTNYNRDFFFFSFSDWTLFLLSDGRVVWTCRYVLSMTAAVTRTVMQKTVGQRPVWTLPCHLWYGTFLSCVLSRLGNCSLITCATFCSEQAELIVIGPGYDRRGLGPFRWLWRVLESATKATGGGPCGTISGTTHGPNASRGGEANPASQKITCGWPG